MLRSIKSFGAVDEIVVLLPALPGSDSDVSGFITQLSQISGPRVRFIALDEAVRVEWSALVPSGRIELRSAARNIFGPDRSIFAATRYDAMRYIRGEFDQVAKLTLWDELAGEIAIESSEVGIA